ncbi:MAG: TetR/AcrR family transcriptional regulator, partial [Tissierellia bacterium]|nr:TetR/AcrR family transcriptional regulator [Tissierellia bacterium]
MRVQDESLNPKILKAAGEEFNKNGFKKATLRHIAKMAGVTTGAIYIRYKNKDELFYALCKSSINAMEEYYDLTDK